MHDGNEIYTARRQLDILERIAAGKPAFATPVKGVRRAITRRRDLAYLFSAGYIQHGGGYGGSVKGPVATEKGLERLARRKKFNDGRKFWTAERKAFVVENEHLTPSQIAKVLGCKAASVAAQRQKLGVAAYRGEQPNFDEREIETVRKYYDAVGRYALAERLGRSPRSVSSLATRLRRKGVMPPAEALRPYSEAEDAYIFAEYARLGPKNIGNEINRTAGAVGARYRMLRKKVALDAKMRRAYQKCTLANHGGNDGATNSETAFY